MAPHQRAFDNLIAKIDPAHVMPEGVRGDCYPLLLRGHWASAEQGVIGVLLEFKSPFSRIDVNLLPLDSLQAHYNSATLEQWQFQLNVLRESCQRQSFLRDNNNHLVSDFPGSLIFGAPLPFHYPTPEQALERLMNLHTSFLHCAHTRRRQSGGYGANPGPANHTAIEALRGRFGELLLLEQHDHTTIWRGTTGLVSLIEESECDATAVMDTAFRLTELRSSAEESATLCLVCDKPQAWRETDRLIQRLKQLHVDLVVTSADDLKQALR